MIASHSTNKSIERIRAILAFIKHKTELEPAKEVFSVKPSELRQFNSYLNDIELLDISFKKITEESNGDIKIEVRWSDIPFTTATGTKMTDCSVRFYIADNNKLDAYLYQIDQDLISKKTKVQLILADTKLYDAENPKLNYSFRGTKSLRYKIFLKLATEKEYIETRDLTDVRDKKTSTEMVRKTIGQIRDGIENKLKINPESVIESNGFAGYRIANVTIKND